MKCILLAAGYATRLYPLTENFPKPLLEVRGKTILDHLVDDVDSCNLIDEYLLVSNHRFVSHFEKWASGKQQRIRVIDDGTISNEGRLGAVKDISLAIEMANAPGCDYLVLAGDNVLDFSLTQFVRYAVDRNASCVMRYMEKDPQRLRKSGVLSVDAHDRVLNMEEKPENPSSNWVCPPFYYYTSADAIMIDKAVAEGCAVDAPGSYVSWLAKTSDVFAMTMPGRRYDIGDLTSYNEVRENFPGITHHK